MGSYWAYYELGWGGWWFWDPVENASFIPWLAGTALLHSALVMEKREALKIWTVLLAIMTFSMSLLGTFLVRSGVLTSVHAFATDPTPRRLHPVHPHPLHRRRAVAVCLPCTAHLKAGGLFAPISREGALVLNNLILTMPRHRPDRHALSAGAGSGDRRQDFRRAALLQHDLRAADAAAAARRALRAAAGLEARRLLGVGQRLYVAAAVGLVAG